MTRFTSVLAGLLAAAALGAADRVAAQFVVGSGAHLGQNLNEVTQSFDWMKSLGIQSFREEMYWSHLEKSPGTYSLSPETGRTANALERAAANGLKPLLILDYGNDLYGGGFPLTDEARAAFAGYARFLASRYRGKVQHYEVWNEWNGGMGHSKPTAEMKSAESYLKLLQVTYAAIKKVDPTAVVIGGAVDGNVRWTEQLVELGGMKSMDILSIHPYMFHAGDDGTPEQLVAYLADLGKRLAARNGGAPPPVFITETGWPTFDSRGGVSRETAADYVVRSYLGVRTIPFVKGMWWYCLRDTGADPKDIQHNFGLLDANRQPKPAYFAMQAVAPLVAPSVNAERLPTPGGEWLVRLRHADGTTVFGLWVPRGGPKDVELTFSVPSDATATISGGASGYREKNRRPLPKGHNRLDLQVSGAPVLIAIQGVEATFEGLRAR